LVVKRPEGERIDPLFLGEPVIEHGEEPAVGERGFNIDFRDQRDAGAREQRFARIARQLLACLATASWVTSREMPGAIWGDGRYRADSINPTRGRGRADGSIDLVRSVVRRSELLQKVWTEDGIYTDPSVETKGIDELVAHRQRSAHISGRAGRARTSFIDRLTRVLRFNWGMVLADGKRFTAGLDVGQLAGDGKLQSGSASRGQRLPPSRIWRPRSSTSPACAWISSISSSTATRLSGRTMCAGGSRKCNETHKRRR
jgi:hypothetical protein